MNSNIDDVENLDVQPIKNWQKIMWELYVIELLIDILYYPFIEDKDLSLLTLEDPLQRICVLCHTLIKFIS